MIITNVCFLLEALSIVVCLYYLYDEKIKLDIVTVCFLSVDMIIMTAINYLKIGRIHTMVIYPIIVIYCVCRFGFYVKKLVVNIVLCIVLIGLTQMAVTFTVCYILDIHTIGDIGLIVIGIAEFLLILFICYKGNVKRLSIFLQNEERILFVSIGVSIVISLIWLISYKKINLMEAYQAILLFSVLGFVLVLSGQLIKYKLKAKEVETELKIHKIYSDSFEGLIEDIKLRQHEFDNHINAIYSQHLFCNTFDELVDAQKKYCKLITKENRFNKLLSQDNPVIRGFLYGKFIEIDEMGIEISYQISIKNLDIGVPVYKIIELLGNLVNNAVEALQTDESRNRLHVEILEKDMFYIEVRNESPYITYDVLGKFFNKGYSEKGNGRGIGLYNVKQTCKEYDLIICCKNIELDGRNWLVFTVQKEKVI